MNRFAKEFMSFTTRLTKRPKYVKLYPTEDNFVKKMNKNKYQDDVYHSKKNSGKRL